VTHLERLRSRRTVLAGVAVVATCSAVWTVLRPQPAAPAGPAPVAVAPAAPVAALPREPAVRRTPPLATIAPSDRWALVIGVSRYAGRVHDTVGGAGDAAAVRAALLKAGWRRDHIKVITDERATRSTIAAGLGWLVARSSDRTFTLFHYSGHVKQTGGREYLWPTDSALMSDRAIAAQLRRIRGRAWFDFAGCEAGGFDEGLATRLRLVTGSSKVTEKSYEYPDWGQSVWTGLMFGRGLDRRRADKNQDRRVTVGEAIAYARREATKITLGQRPYGAQRPYVKGGGSLDWTLDQIPLPA
jgi:hypothetical protein